jgi:hypothetical protein
MPVDASLLAADYSFLLSVLIQREHLHERWFALPITLANGFDFSFSRLILAFPPVVFGSPSLEPR